MKTITDHQRRLNALYIGSCSDTDIGIGTILTWRFTQLKSITQDEGGDYTVTNKIGEVFHCYDLKIYEASNPHESVSLCEDLPLWPDDREELET